MTSSRALLMDKEKEKRKKKGGKMMRFSPQKYLHSFYYSGACRVIQCFDAVVVGLLQKGNKKNKKKVQKCKVNTMANSVRQQLRFAKATDKAFCS